MADITAPPNLPVSTDEMSPVMRDAIAHIFSSANPVAFHGTIPVETVTPMYPPRPGDENFGGYFHLEYVGGGTASAYGDHVAVMAGAANRAGVA